MISAIKATLLTLVASSAFVAAAPGGDWGASTCTTEYITTTTCGTSETTFVETKTVYVPVTEITEFPKTTVVPYPETSISESIKTITTWETYLETKTIPVTTWTTEVETKSKEQTSCETIPYTIILTSYKTEVTTCPETYVTSTPSESVCTSTEEVSYTSTIVETKTECSTKGYGW